MPANIHHTPTHISDPDKITAESKQGGEFRWIDLKADGQTFAHVFYTPANARYLDRLATAINAVPDQKTVDALLDEVRNAPDEERAA